MSLALSVRAKGMRLFDRALTVLGRFGVTPAKMETLLGRYCDVVQAAGASPTLPITASVLARHRSTAHRLRERGVELAIHGLHHNDFALLDGADQHKQIVQAIDVFNAASVPFVGFRGPYLRSNDETASVLRDEGFLYESSHTVMFSLVDEPFRRRRHRIAYGRAIGLYAPQDARRVPVRPRDVGGLIDIPVALPDDEILIDRLGYGPERIAEVWLAILSRTYASSELFTLQLHPERIRVAEDALRAVLDRARSLEPRVWIATLSEIALWWRHRATLSLELSETSPGRYCARIVGGTADDGASIAIRCRTSPHGPVAATRSTQREISVESERKPLVGLACRSDESVRRFLTEEGFLWEIADDPSPYGAYLDLPSRTWDGADLLAAIDRGPGPLVRLARWPHAAQSALAVTGDIDSITLGDFFWRMWETWR